MKQITPRELKEMKKTECDELLKSPFELGKKEAGRGAEFFPKGVYLPLAEYEKLKGELK